MKYSIQIHKPCNEPWDNMHPNSNGRHCDQCSKTVVDFTDWKQGDIVAYLQEQGTEKVCGRFKNEQLATVDTDTFVVSRLIHYQHQ